jgi:DNA polymerase-3 subunit gamma/tau
MNAQVYYRRWRPGRFEDLVGQEPVARTLRQAIARNRIAHAYLFCGPRGTGKTSTARILAKAANCLSPQDGEPCNLCRLCLAVNEGRALDLVEIDAASNRGIDEVRSIREKVHYAPAEGRYKVYVLDEAHMLTDAAADALLKTLEEPPPHIIFILATTDPQKLAPTIVSRCQRYDFRRLEVEAMAGMLARICQSEGVQADPSALRAISRNADGSMRDAESLLEQAVTSFGSPLTSEQVRLLLGIADDERVRALVRQMLQAQVPEALATLSAIASEGLSLRHVHRQMVDGVRDLLLIKAGARQMASQPEEVTKEQTQLLQGTPMERLLYTLRQLGQVVFRPEAPPTLALELAIIEAAQGNTASQSAPAVAAPSPTAAQRPVVESRSAVRPVASPPVARQERPAPAHGQSTSPPAGPRPPTPPAAEPPTAASDGATPEERLRARWGEIVRSLERRKGRRYYLGPLLKDCKQYRLENGTLFLEFVHQSHMERIQEEMDTPEGRRQFMDTITKAVGLPSPPKLELIAPNAPQRTDKASRSPLVQAALSMGGRIIDETEEKDDDE